MHLKRILLIFTLIISTALTNAIASENSASDILGLWLSEKKDGVIKISKEGDSFIGHLIAFKKKKEDLGKTVLDKNNPDEALSKKELKGIKMLKNFSFEDNEWSGGTIYDPQSGKTYKSYMSLEDKDTLNLRGYIGLPMFGRTSKWTRISEIPKFEQ